MEEQGANATVQATNAKGQAYQADNANNNALLQSKHKTMVDMQMELLIQQIIWLMHKDKHINKTIKTLMIY